MLELRFVPGARRRKIRVKREMAFGLDPLEYHASGGTVRRLEPKRPKGVSTRQWKKARRKMRRGDQGPGTRDQGPGTEA